MAETPKIEGNYTFIKHGQKVEAYIPKSTDTLVIIPSNVNMTGFIKNQFWNHKQ